MAIRVSPLMGLGAIAQGYEQQRNEAARRQLIEEQLRAQALARAAQGAIGATLGAPGGIGAGVGSSPYAGLADLGGGGVGGGDPTSETPPPASMPNDQPSYGSGTKFSTDTGGGAYGNAPKANTDMRMRAMDVWRQLAAGGAGSPEFDASIPPQFGPGAAPPPGIQPGQPYGSASIPPPHAPSVMAPQGGAAQPGPPQQPPGAFRNLMPMRPNNMPTVPAYVNPQPVPGGAQPQPPPTAGGYGPGAAGIYVPPGGNQPVNIQGGQPVNPAAPLPRPPMGGGPGGTAPAAPAGAGGSAQAGGGQQTLANFQQQAIADLLNPERGFQFSKSIALQIKAANPNISNEVLAQATADLIKSFASQDRLGTALAIAQLNNATRTGIAQYKGGVTEDVTNKKIASGEKIAASHDETRKNVAATQAQTAANRLAATQARWKQIDAQREQKRQDGLRRGDATDYKQSINAELHELQSELGNPARRNPLLPEEIQARESRVKYLISLLQQTQVRTSPQQPQQQPSQ